jgi:two-component system response regulator AlgR
VNSVETRIVIVDDEPLARERLAQMVEGLPGYRVLESCASAQAAMDVITRKEPDVVLLDISMPGMTGMELSRYIMGLEHCPAIIFCTAHDEHALAAFDTGAVGYLLKPVREGKLLESLESARRVNRMQMKSLQETSTPRQEIKNFCIESHRGTELVPLSAVSHLVADQKYITLFHDKGTSLLETSLKAVEEEYPDYFVRVHRNTLASVERIAGIRRSSDGDAHLVLHGSSHSPKISRRHLKEIKQLLADM